MSAKEEDPPTAAAPAAPGAQGDAAPPAAPAQPAKKIGKKCVTSVIRAVDCPCPTDNGQPTQRMHIDICPDPNGPLHPTKSQHSGKEIPAPRPSLYRGVFWNPTAGRWRACISVGNLSRSLGYYHTDEEGKSVERSVDCRLYDLPFGSVHPKAAPAHLCDCIDPP